MTELFIDIFIKTCTALVPLIIPIIGISILFGFISTLLFDKK